MAPIKVTRNVFLVVLIIFSCVMICSEAGRTLLKVKNNVNFEEIKTYGAGVSEKYGYGGKEAAGFFGGAYDIDRRGLGDDQTDDQSVMGTTDDLRPTAPGHSPGAGHSRGPTNVDPNQ